MPRLINPVEWSLVSPAPSQSSTPAPLVSLANTKGHQLHVHPINGGLVRVVHSLPQCDGRAPLRNHGRQDSVAGVDGFAWEERRGDWHVAIDDGRKQATLTTGSRLRICVDYSYTVTLSWYWDQTDGATAAPFLCDFKSAYMYDAQTQRVYHQVCREQSYMPLSEHARPANENHIAQPERYEFVYGLGESKGPMMKDGKRYLMEARDSLGADPQDTDPLYKLCPFYLHHNRRTGMWYGLYYNTLSPSVFDFSGEHDFATGEFRSFSAESAPLDYYLLLGEETQEECPSLPSIVSQLARLVTPYSTGPAGDDMHGGWQASPTLPNLNQFGYLASSLTLSERNDAQVAVVEYVQEARRQGFPIDSMHLSSGYAVDSQTGERNYFTWDRTKYPDPAALGRRLEGDLHCTVIINVKPWLLETHAFYAVVANKAAFVRAAPDARPERAGEAPQDTDRCGAYASQPARTMHWSKGMGVTGKGSYFDFSSDAGCREWQQLMDMGVLANNITGVWIDNNEFSSLIDDEEELQGDIDMWSLPSNTLGTHSHDKEAGEVAARMGWGKRPTTVGSVGRHVLTMGMARATYQHLYTQLPHRRPIVVTRSAVPGMQAYAHATWSGDNSTSWLSLKWSTKLTLSVGLSFGLGLYGHDIGGFAGQHSPSPELLIRWCQQSMWHTRFTIHSWKPISTTPWMYGKAETDMIRATIMHRYRLIPMLYSLYVTDYHRKGWPVLKPMLWHHADDFVCLTLDEQFLVGSHVLVAPVCDAGARRTTIHLPSLVDGAGADSDACWFELVADRWHRPSKEGHDVTLGENRQSRRGEDRTQADCSAHAEAPLDRCPTLVRDGGIIVLSPPVTDYLALPNPSPRTRTVCVYPTPADVLAEGRPGQHTSRGSFSLIEDDGCSNDAANDGHYTEISVFFEADEARVVVGAYVVRAGYAATWDIDFLLPAGDERRVCLDGRSSVDSHVLSSTGRSVTLAVSRHA